MKSRTCFYILVSKYEVGQLKNIVLKYDPHAFIVMNEGVTVIGHYKKEAVKKNCKNGIHDRVGAIFYIKTWRSKIMLNLYSAGNLFTVFLHLSLHFFGSQVRCMPSFLKMPSSTEESRTEE